MTRRTLDIDGESALDVALPSVLRRKPLWVELQLPATEKVLVAIEADPQGRSFLASLAGVPHTRPMSPTHATDERRTLGDAIPAALAIFGVGRRSAPTAPAVHSPLELPPTRKQLFAAGRWIADSIADGPLLHADPIENVSLPSMAGKLLRALWRLQELTRDRFGLLACQSMPAARSAIRAGAAAPISSAATADELFHSPDARSFELLRLVAIAKFAQSSQFHNYLMTPSPDSIQNPQVAISDGRARSCITRPATEKVETRNMTALDPSPYRIGDYVEVQLDGNWHSGQIANIVSSDDLYIRLDGEPSAWHFSLLSDVVRPTSCQPVAHNPRVRGAA